MVEVPTRPVITYNSHEKPVFYIIFTLFIRMTQRLRWIREEKGGAHGGEYYHLDTGDGWLPAAKVAEQSKEMRSDYVAYGVRAENSQSWYCADYSSNQNNRHYSVNHYRHDDFPDSEPSNWRDYEKPDCRERGVGKKLGYDQILDQTYQTDTFRRRRRQVNDLQPEVRRLANACDPEFTRASPAVAQAIDNMNQYLVSAAMLGRGGTRSIGNVKKYLQQAYEVEAVRSATSAKVIEGDLRRRWISGGYPPGDGDVTVSWEVLEQLGIGFGEPNFILDAERTYSIWLEFPFTKYLRPDLFVLPGKHKSAFRGSVRSFLNEYDESFFQEVVNQWKDGFANAFDIGDNNTTTSGPTSDSIQSFVLELSEHLKPGLVIESKEENGDVIEIEKQIRRYDSIFTAQDTALLTWFEWTGEVPPQTVVLDEFDTTANSAQNLVNLIDQTVR